MEKVETPASNKYARHGAVQVSVGILAFALAYLVFSLALDRGSLLAYALSFILVVIGLRALAMAVRGAWHHKQM